MEYIAYFDGRRVRRLPVEGLFEARQRAPRRSSHGRFASGAAMAAVRPQQAGAMLASSLSSQQDRFSASFAEISESRTLISPVDRGDTAMIPTQAVAIDAATRADIRFLRSRYGMEEVAEGSHGKALMRSPGDAQRPVEHAAEAALALHQERGASSAPNFLRVVQRTPVPAVSPHAEQWGLDNTGTVGIIGADVHALAAWTMTRGDGAIRVAVLDEGVDSDHPALHSQVVAEADFVDGNAHGKPDGDDAHGTACAGIVASGDEDVSGLGPDLSLVGVRIAKSGANDVWIFDDFATADAIDWSWDDASADVLSNSWGGGAPSPLITNAFRRAAADGRDGLGSVVVVAAGNSQSPVDYPGNLPGVLTVGASNEWDKRKTTTSQDGESWWGSNFGVGLDVMAPGVHIATTDISGGSGYSPSDFALAFNGTSSATPFVAATAALMLSANPDLTEERVREIIRETADPLTVAGGWSKFTGYGRTNSYSAIRQARRG